MKNWSRRSVPVHGAVLSLIDFQKFIGYRFEHPELLETALRHRSILQEIGETRLQANERLEFLGDAVLDLVVSEQLYSAYPENQEGFLARLKSNLVSGRQLAIRGRKMKLGAYVQLSDAEAQNGGRDRSSILEDTMEAVIGAIYLDGGLAPAEKFIKRFIIPVIDADVVHEQEQNFKSMLLEYAQGKALGAPKYRVITEEGPDHAKVFHVEALLRDKRVGIGVGQSKKKAEQEAAKAAARRYGLSPHS